MLEARPGEQFGNVYQVVRPTDGMVVPLTCTEEQLQSWLDQGYKLVVEEEVVKSPVTKKVG